MSEISAFPKRGLFIAGTDTDVGKTYVSALLARLMVAAGHRVGVYKPAASGGTMQDGRCVCDDATILWEAAGRPATVHDVCPQMFLAPLAPNTAALAEGKEVDSRLLVDGLSFWTDKCDFAIVEGAGGLLSPIADDQYVADVAIAIGYPVIVVTANRLGTINQTLQTLMTAGRYKTGLNVVGVVVNDVADDSKSDPSRSSNADSLRERCDLPVLTHVKHGQAEMSGGFDWEKLFGRPA